MKQFLFSLQVLILPFLLEIPQSVDLTATKQLESPLTCNLPAPSYLNSQVTSTSTADLNWSSVSGAYAYFLVVTDNGSPFLQATVFGTTRTLAGLTTGHTYHCTVASMCNGSEVSDYIIAYDINP